MQTSITMSRQETKKKKNQTHAVGMVNKKWNRLKKMANSLGDPTSFNIFNILEFMSCTVKCLRKNRNQLGSVSSSLFFIYSFLFYFTVRSICPLYMLQSVEDIGRFLSSKRKMSWTRKIDSLASYQVLPQTFQKTLQLPLF